jgi:hypothetical protein
VSNQKERIRKRKRQQAQSRWLIVLGVVIVLAPGLWIALVGFAFPHINEAFADIARRSEATLLKGLRQ